MLVVCGTLQSTLDGFASTSRVSTAGFDAPTRTPRPPAVDADAASSSTLPPHTPASPFRAGQRPMFRPHMYQLCAAPRRLARLDRLSRHLPQPEVLRA